MLIPVKFKRKHSELAKGCMPYVWKPVSLQDYCSAEWQEHWSFIR